MSRRVLPALLLVMLTASIATLPANARGKRMPRHVTKRTVSVGYNYVASSNERPIEYNLAEPLEVGVKKNERWASITIEDVTTRPVGAEVTQDLDGDGTPDTSRTVCGKTRIPLTIAAGKPLTITLRAGPCSGDPGSATSGTVHVELYSPAPKPPPSVPKVERTVAFSYTGWFYQGDSQVAVGAYTIETSSSEVYVELHATDLTGLPPHLQVHPENGRSFKVCGASDEPIGIEPGTQIRISVSPAPCADGRPAAMTSGDIEVTLSNVP